MKSDLQNIPTLSSSYFPPIEYMAHFVNNNKINIEVQETYPKQTYRNRCRIMTANGILDLSIPITKPSGNTSKTKDIKLLYQERWQINHWRAMVSAYSGSPFFLYYQDELESFFNVKENLLIDLNSSILQTLLELLEIDCEVNYTEEFIKPNTLLNDFRFSITPKKNVNKNHFETYTQVFSDKFSFCPNLSILDLIFNLGPESTEYLRKLTV